MIFVALGLLGFGVADLVRWSPGPVAGAHLVAAIASGAVAVGAVAALSGVDAGGTALAGVVALILLALWSAYDLLPEKHAKPEYALGLIVLTIVILVGLSGSADPIGGDIADWYANLGFDLAGEISVDQFVLGVAATLFLIGTGNRIVRFTLAATDTSLLDEEGKMRGGRVLGPMERVIVAAAVISGGLAGAGFVIAAKGLLRFREIRGDTQSKVDEITEYFLIGTFTSVIVAAAVSVLVLAAS